MTEILHLILQDIWHFLGFIILSVFALPLIYLCLYLLVFFGLFILILIENIFKK